MRVKVCFQGPWEQPAPCTDPTYLSIYAHTPHQARAEHGVYGYSVPLQEVTQEVVTYLKRTAHYKVCIVVGEKGSGHRRTWVFCS